MNKKTRADYDDVYEDTFLEIGFDFLNSSYNYIMFKDQIGIMITITKVTNGRASYRLEFDIGDGYMIRSQRKPLYLESVSLMQDIVDFKRYISNINYGLDFVRKETMKSLNKMVENA